MSKGSKKIIDSVSASQLLKALNLLQNMSNLDNDNEISFCDESKIKSQFKTNNSKVINYNQYMANKVQNKQKTPIKAKKKSISPLKEDNVNQTIKLSNIKSRSYSPINSRPEKTDRSMLITQKKQTNNPIIYQNKQNKRQYQNSKNQNNYRASFQSKKILDEKQRKGSAYIPIQFRTEQLLRQKQVKLAKLQRQQQLINILREKQCTFKPNIIKNYKKVKNIIQKQQKVLKQIEQTNRFEETQQNEFLCTSAKPINEQHNESGEYLFSNQKIISSENENRNGFKKYKNQQFNILLDLIN